MQNGVANVSNAVHVTVRNNQMTPFSDEAAKRVSPFTDDHLKRLEEDMERLGDFPVGNYRLRPLLARLEAAENPARQLQHNHAEDRLPHNLCRRCNADRTWRKAAGKDKGE